MLVHNVVSDAEGGESLQLVSLLEVRVYRTNVVRRLDATWYGRNYDRDGSFSRQGQGETVSICRLSQTTGWVQEQVRAVLRFDLGSGVRAPSVGVARADCLA